MEPKYQTAEDLKSHGAATFQELLYTLSDFYNDIHCLHEGIGIISSFSNINKHDFVQMFTVLLMLR
jgi:hypothetical protein